MLMVHFLNARQPFSLTSVIRSHGWFQLLPFASPEDASSLEYVLELSGGKVVRLTFREANGGANLTVSEELDAAEQEEVQAAAAWMLELDFDLSSFYAIAQDEPKLAHAVTNARGRILRCATVFEDVVKTILTTNTSWGGTKRMVRGLVEKYGAALASDPEQKAFPTASQLAKANVEALRQECKLGYRAPYVLELAQKQAAGEIDLEELKANHLPTAELRKQLLALKGVGDYAAANLLMLLERYDYIPVDSWALMMVSKEWFDGQPVRRAEVEAAFEKWGEWKGLAYWLWDWSASSPATDG
jgi:3-methyladenine DNA glycosylase/8-oxoguanine DNA glycosylase